MCQQILQFCSGSTKPLLFAGGLSSLLLAVAIGYTGYTTNALYSEIDPQVAVTRSLGFHLQLAAAVYLVLVTVFSCYAAYYDEKHSIRALSGVSTLNLVLALAAIFFIPSGDEISQSFRPTLEQAAQKYNFTDTPLSVVNSSAPGFSNLTVLSSTTLAQPATDNRTGERPTRSVGGKESVQKAYEMTAANATRMWDSLQSRGCCGITNSTDWHTGGLPKSCCEKPEQEHKGFVCKQADSHHQLGCLALIGSTSLNLQIVLALIALVNFYLAIISGISAYKTYSYSEASQSAYS